MENLYYVLAILGAIPMAWAGLWFLVRLTKTKTDDRMMERIEK